MRSLFLIAMTALCASPALAQDRSSVPTAQQLENVHAFAKLYGYVRYFHPSDEAAALDWDAFAVHGAARVRDARDAAHLRQVLLELFSPVAPTLRVTDREDSDERVSELFPADTTDLLVVAWQHVGLGSGRANTPYRSVRTHRETTLTGGSEQAILAQSFDASALRGAEVRFTGFGRAQNPDSRVQLWLRVDRAAGMGFFDNMYDRPVTSADWSGMEIRGTVDADAESIFVGALLYGTSAALDALTLERRTEDGWESVPLANAGFEEHATATGVPGWSFNAQGWNATSGESDAHDGERYLHVARAVTTIRGPLFAEYPRPGAVVRERIGTNLVAHVPIALWSRDGQTLGSSRPEALAALHAALANIEPARRGVNDEALRLADVIVLWNVFQHFYPYWDIVGADRDAMLTTALRQALAGDADTHMATLQWMVHEIEDGHGSVSNPLQPRPALLPFTVNWIQEQAVVVAVPDSLPLRPGDVILAVDGEAVADLVREGMQRYSGSEHWRRWTALTRLGSGSQAVVEVSYLRDDEIRSVSVERRRTMPVQEPRPAMIEELEPNVYYVDLGRAPMDSIQNHMSALAAAHGVIFDLRGYPSGNHEILRHLSDTPFQSARFLVPQITRPDGAEPVEYRDGRWNMAPAQPRIGGNVVFVTDERAISYAESVMGIVEHYRMGEIVGGATAGTNGNVNPIQLPSGHVVTWTGMRVVKHDGSRHHLIGIQPTVPVTRTIEGVRAGRDELLERALELVRGSM